MVLSAIKTTDKEKASDNSIKKMSIDIFLGTKNDPKNARIDVEIVMEHRNGSDLGYLDFIFPYTDIANIQCNSSRFFDPAFGNYLYTHGWRILDPQESKVYIDGVEARILDFDYHLGREYESTMLRLFFRKHYRGHDVCKPGNTYAFIISLTIPLHYLVVQEADLIRLDIRIYDHRDLNSFPDKLRKNIFSSMLQVEMAYLWVVLPEIARPKNPGNAIWGILERPSQKNPWGEPVRVVYSWQHEHLYDNPLHAYCEYEIPVSPSQILHILKDIMGDSKSLDIVRGVASKSPASASDIAEMLGLRSSGSSLMKIRKEMRRLRDAGILEVSKKTKLAEYFEISSEHPISKIIPLLRDEKHDSSNSIYVR